MMRYARYPRFVVSMMLPLTVPMMAAAQVRPLMSDVKTGGSARIQVVSHVPLDGAFRVGGVEIESELSRPYA